jgi:hypothetical protein
MQEAYRLSVDGGDVELLIERNPLRLHEALNGFYDELCPNGPGLEPTIPEDGVALYIVPVTVSDEEWDQAERLGHEWEGFWS